MIGKRVHVVIDRPLGSVHPEHANIVYEVNYGYIPGIIGGDGEEQDAYVLGVYEPIESFNGTVIAIVSREDDVEEKWVVAPDAVEFSAEEITKRIAFQEKYFKSAVHTEGSREGKIEIYSRLPDGAKYVRTTVFTKEQELVDEWDDIDERAKHFLLMDGKKPIATCRLFKKDDTDIYILGRFAVLAEYRRIGVGRRMLNEAEKYAYRMGGKCILLHSQCSAENFYAKNGYSRVGGVEYEQGRPHVWMKKTISFS